jgi:hypothetical protein
MSRFQLPPFSPLIGSTPSNFLRVMRHRKLAAKYYPKLFNTVILLLFTSLFHWLDRRYYKKRIDGYVFRKSPLFIIGHWRSGTTLLHNLLATDSVFGFTTTYQAVFPNNLRSKWIFKNFMRFLMPTERPGDGVRITVDLPQEDEYALSNITKLSFYHFFYRPLSYKKFYDENVRFCGISEDALHQWLLQYQQLTIKSLMNSHGQQALIKNPANTGRIALLLDIFPEAHFIYIVRNPVEVYLSTKKFFTELLPTTAFEQITDQQLSDCIIYIYSNLLKDYLAEKEKVSTDRLIEIRFEEFIADPLKTLADIYAKFGFSNYDAALPGFKSYIESQKQHPMNRYSIGRQELQFVTEQLDFAMKHFQYEVPSNLEIIPEVQTTI